MSTTFRELLPAPHSGQRGTCAKAGRHVTAWKECWPAVSNAEGSHLEPASLSSGCTPAPWLQLLPVSPSSVPNQQSPLPPDSPSGCPVVPQTQHPFQIHAPITLKGEHHTGQMSRTQETRFHGTLRDSQRDRTDLLEATQGQYPHEPLPPFR